MISENDLQNYDAFQKGDIVCFEHLVVKYRDQLVSFIYRYTKDYYLAQDLAQDAFVDVLLQKDKVKRGGNFKAYLFTIGRNKAVDYIRKNKKYLFVDEMAHFDEPVIGMEDAFIQEDDKKELYRRINALKFDYQIVLTLIDLEDMSYEEAAKVMGKTLSQVKILIHRARKSLAKLYEKEGNSFAGLE